MENIILNVDSYKLSQWIQYPPNTTKVISYIESRGGKFDKTLFFGLQIFLKKILSQKITQDMVEEAALLAEMHGEPFNYKGWMYIVNELNGKLPLKIKAVKEGSVVPTHNVLATVENTDDKCAWLVSWFETSILQAVWYPTTVATLSFNIKKLIKKYLLETCENPEAELSFKLHDFGARGVSSVESAGIGGAAHLVNFMGTDTIPALLVAKKYYNELMAGFSIPASEHSTITSWGRKGESVAYANMIQKFSKPGAIFACVSDSYDLWNAIENIWGDELKLKLITSGGRLVVRPDSGNPPEVVLKTVQLLEKKFGSKTNSKGFKVLSDCVRVIQGDGINFESIQEILEALKKHGYSAENIAFGMGGMLLQGINRDTQKFAYKCSLVKVNGEWRGVSKDPITDPGKRSKEGYLELVNVDGNFITESYPNPGYTTVLSQLDVVYENGEVKREQSFKEIREIANKYC